MKKAHAAKQVDDLVGKGRKNTTIKGIGNVEHYWRWHRLIYWRGDFADTAQEKDIAIPQIIGEPPRNAVFVCCFDCGALLFVPGDFWSDTD